MRIILSLTGISSIEPDVEKGIFRGRPQGFEGKNVCGKKNGANYRSLRRGRERAGLPCVHGCSQREEQLAAETGKRQPESVLAGFGDFPLTRDTLNGTWDYYALFLISDIK